ncbi:MAG TPA: CapA family protein [Anaerolineae bacterium]|nr:CapA family protein [Anaerolineae bacterium]
MRRTRDPTSRQAACLVLACLVLAAWAPASPPGTSPCLGQPAGRATAVDQPEPGPSVYPWLYLRDGGPPALGERFVEVVAAGDIMLGRGVSAVADPLSVVAPWLSAADIAMGNLECVIAEAGSARPGPYRLRAPVSAVSTLVGAGLDVVTLANNHVLDFGPGALAEMAARLQAAGIDFAGAGSDAGSAGRPAFREVGGLRFAFLAFNQVPDPADRPSDSGWTRAGWNREAAVAAVAAARTQADAVIISIHWGYEYDLRIDPSQRADAHALAEAGADLVVGHHPHVVQGTELIGGNFVAYSLGNLVFDQQQEGTRQGLALRAFFDRDGLRAVQALPVSSGPRPSLMEAGEASSLLARVRPPLSRIGFACDENDCRPVAVPQDSATGLFRAGSIDMTGDGHPEQVQLLRQRITIFQDGEQAWASPQEWRVVDAALGDPNDDGRGEVLIAFWRPASPDREGSHPFIVGSRRGAYRVLWGGSAVDHPILEVELADVDGDGVHDLVALAERSEGRAVSLWHWHGWGFSELWRSPPGRYQDLVLLPAEHGVPPSFSAALEP